MKFVLQFSNSSQTALLDKPIGVFDSGVGGISILKEICSLLPHEHYWYYGDSANAPYGTKSADEIRRLTYNKIDHMVTEGIKALVIACNTATSAAASSLRERYKGMPIIGMEPEIKTPALIDHGKVLVMATPMTLRLEKFNYLLERYKNEAEFIILPCPGLPELIEQGNPDSVEIKEYLSRLLQPHINTNINAIVLGCTHYLHIKAQIKNALESRHITFYDGAVGAAKELKRQLQENNMLSDYSGEGEILIENSKQSEDMLEISRLLFTSHP